MGVMREYSSKIGKIVSLNCSKSTFADKSQEHFGIPVVQLQMCTQTEKSKESSNKLHNGNKENN